MAPHPDRSNRPEAGHHGQDFPRAPAIGRGAEEDIGEGVGQEKEGHQQPLPFGASFQAHVLQESLVHQQEGDGCPVEGPKEKDYPNDSDDQVSIPPHASSLSTCRSLLIFHLSSPLEERKNMPPRDCIVQGSEERKGFSHPVHKGLTRGDQGAEISCHLDVINSGPMGPVEFPSPPQSTCSPGVERRCR